MKDVSKEISEIKNAIEHYESMELKGGSYNDILRDECLEVLYRILEKLEGESNES